MSAGDAMLQEIAVKTAKILRPLMADMIREAFEEAQKVRPVVQVTQARKPETLTAKNLKDIFKVGDSTLNIGVTNGRFPPPVSGGGAVGSQRRHWNAQDVYDTVRLGRWDKVLDERTSNMSKEAKLHGSGAGRGV